MSQHRIDLTSLQGSYMRSDENGSQEQLDIENKNAFPLQIMNRNKSQGPTNTISFCHGIDPRFDQLMRRCSSKISPNPSNVDTQKMSKQSTETSISDLKLSSDASLVSRNQPSNQVDSTETTFTSKMIRRIRSAWNEDRRMACPYMLICILCVAVIVVPIALLFGLPKERATNLAATTITETTVTISTATTETTTSSTTITTTTTTTETTTSTTTETTTTTTTETTTSSTTETTTTTTTTTTSTTTTTTTETTTTATETTTTTVTTTTTATTTTTTETTTTTTTTSPTCSSAGHGTLATFNRNPTNWTQYQYNQTATAAVLTIMFGFTCDASAQRIWFLDDVSIVDVLTPSIQLLQNPSFDNSTSALTGWTQYCTSTCPGGSTNAGQVATGANCTSTNCYMDHCYYPFAIDFLSQTISTTIGHVYTISFWIIDYGTGPNAATWAYVDLY